jgi:hypothetical protein
MVLTSTHNMSSPPAVYRSPFHLPRSSQPPVTFAEPTVGAAVPSQRRAIPTMKQATFSKYSGSGGAFGSRAEP